MLDAGNIGRSRDYSLPSGIQFHLQYKVTIIRSFQIRAMDSNYYLFES